VSTLEKIFLKFFNEQKLNEKLIKIKDYRTYIFEVVLLIVVIFLISLMFPRGKSYQFSGLKEGEIYIGDKIIAPFTFAINKTEEDYRKDVREAKSNVLTVFVKNDSICESQQQKLMLFFNQLHRVLNSSTDYHVITTQLIDFLKSNGIDPDENILKFFGRATFQSKSRSLKLTEKDELYSYREILSRIVRDLCSVGILNLNKNQIISKDNKISVINKNEEIIEDLKYFHDQENAKSIVIEKLRAVIENDELSVNIGYRIFMKFLEANVLYDQGETDYRTREAEANVPRARGTVLENEKIIDSYEKITKDHLMKLNSLAIEKAQREEGANLFYSILRYAGKLLLITVGLSIIVIFLIFNRWRLLKSLKKVILIAVIILLVTLLSFLIGKFTQSSYLMPITIASMLLTIFYDNRMGFVGTVGLSIILGGMLGNEFIIMVVSIFAGTVATMSVVKVRSRSWFLRSILMISGAYIFSITAIEILRYTTLQNLLKYWLYGSINGFLSPLLAYGLQVLIEYVFDMITDLRLLELSDLNRPLLRKLAVKAPGTYHHSIMVGSLAENAAEAIGANALLARVGAYYHDIGKIEKPDYFIENIKKSKNPHEKLSPSMSCLILTNHVRKGLEFAKEYKLPQEITDFIAEHHGTTVMTFFYNKALQQNKDSEIDISTFRYPGPKPRSKEKGIVMLADSVEAASRSLKDPSASRLKGLITSIVSDRFKEFELDECPLTLRDLNKIINSFQTILLGTFHGRVEYPDQNEKFFPKNNNGKEKVNESSN